MAVRSRSIRFAGPVLLPLALLIAIPAAAQIGAPIGAPVGVPHGLPTGVAGYRADTGGGLPPPVNNWSSNEAGRNTFGDRFNTGISNRLGAPAPRPNPQVDVPLPQHQVQQATAAGAGRGSGNDRSSASAAGDPAGRDLRGPVTRPIAAAEISTVEVLRDLVQRGQMHETGLGRPRDLGRAFDLYCEAARSGYPDALIRMGWMYADGVGVEKNHSAASTLFRRAARFGSEAGNDLAKRFAGKQVLLPQCLKGTIVERGTAERPATTAELSAMALKFESPLLMRNPVIGAERSRLINSVLAEARTYKLDPRLVLAVMATESGFDPNAKSPKNAWGLMQLIPETAERFNVKNILDPIENIRGGMAYLRWLLSYFRGDVTLTLAAYNAGEGAVDRHSGVPPFAETLAYVQRIRAAYPFDRHPYDASISNTISRTAPAATTRTVDANAIVGVQTPVARN